MQTANHILELTLADYRAFASRNDTDQEGTMALEIPGWGSSR